MGFSTSFETRIQRDDSNNRYPVEVRIRLEGGIEIAEGEYSSVDWADAPIGFNLALGDVDKPENSCLGRLHHETWWVGKTSKGKPEERVKLSGVLLMT